MNIIVGIGMLSLPFCFRGRIDASVAAGIQIDYPRLMSIATSAKIEWIPFVLCVLVMLDAGFSICSTRPASSLRSEINDQIQWLSWNNFLQL
jgi:hypothetical protein